MRVLCYAQPLTGVGHFFRMHALACGLSEAHEVHLVDGGRPVPHARGAVQPRIVELSPLCRSGDDLVALGTTATAGSVLEHRARALSRAAAQIRPDVVLIDHYPFSKWEIEGEIAAAIDAARACHPTVRVLCSLRDIVGQSRYERMDRNAYEERVLDKLRARFDGILVHADPAFTRLEEHFGRYADLPVPVKYTGFVAQPPTSVLAVSNAAPYAVLSCGGGARGLAFLLTAMEAFRRLAVEGVLGSMRLVVFPAAFASGGDLETLAAAAERGPFQLRRFGPEFNQLLGPSALSISRAGYNTCAALLGARVCTVLSPDPTMPDQQFRARRLAQLGLATCVDGNPPDIAALMAAIRTALAGSPPPHGFAVDGVARTRALVETVEAWGGQ